MSRKRLTSRTIASAKADLDKALLDMKTVPVLSAMDAERRRLALEEAQARYKQILQEVKFMDVGLKANRALLNSTSNSPNWNSGGPRRT